jgi:hypothetical protein
VNYAIAAVCLYLCLEPLKDAVSRVREFAED